ncbi:MAG: hypothetical protein VX757_00415, partial [Planctomycetota bacterium]|nr:hypothetical protein [Planctomycetota bacterium]
YSNERLVFSRNPPRQLKRVTTPKNMNTSKYPPAQITEVLSANETHAPSKKGEERMGQRRRTVFERGQNQAL